MGKHQSVTQAETTVGQQSLQRGDYGNSLPNHALQAEPVHSTEQVETKRWGLWVTSGVGLAAVAALVAVAYGKRSEVTSGVGHTDIGPVIPSFGAISERNGGGPVIPSFGAVSSPSPREVGPVIPSFGAQPSPSDTYVGPVIPSFGSTIGG